VRNLERELAGVFRKCARKIIKEGKHPIAVDRKMVAQFLGVAKVPKDKNEQHDQVGMVNGLAWTEYGGEVLHTEATTMPGKGKLIVTGMLKDVMKESAQAAVTYVRSKAKKLGIADKFFEENDMHIHFPGSMPKDGPSAGVTMATALVSAITKIPVRKDVAMTGEITLRGRVTPIGGLKEKLLAAHRLGIKTVLVPRENGKDLKEVPKKVRAALRVVLVDFVDEVLREALVLEKPETFFNNRVDGPAAVETPVAS
jgi:ATP-dependent Lon protease